MLRQIIRELDRTLATTHLYPSSHSTVRLHHGIFNSRSSGPSRCPSGIETNVRLPSCLPQQMPPPSLQASPMPVQQSSPKSNVGSYMCTRLSAYHLHVYDYTHVCVSMSICMSIRIRAHMFICMPVHCVAYAHGFICMPILIHLYACL